jgi:hypothetical protein
MFLATSLSLEIVDDESPGAFFPSNAANASPKSPVDMPFKYSQGSISSMFLLRLNLNRNFYRTEVLTDLKKGTETSINGLSS